MLICQVRKKRGVVVIDSRFKHLYRKAVSLRVLKRLTSFIHDYPFIGERHFLLVCAQKGTL